MIKEAIEKVLSLAPVAQISIDGREYTDRAIHAVKTPTISPLLVSTLSGFVDLIDANFEEFPADKVLVHVIDHETVQLVHKESNEWADRVVFIKSSVTQTKGFTFGNFIDHENFLIGVQSNFTADGDREYVLKLASNISSEKVATSDDDGVSQKVGVKAGAHLKTSEVVRPRVTLAPYRTFREVSQPTSEFVFRVQDGVGNIPRLALFEADGGAWKLVAMENVARYLRAAITKIPVIS